MSAPNTTPPEASGRGVLLTFLLEPFFWVVFFVLFSISATRAVGWMLAICVALLGGALLYVGHKEARAEEDKPAPTQDTPP